MLNDGYVEHIVKTKTSGGVTGAMATGAALAIAGGVGIALIHYGFSLVIIGIVVFCFAFSRRETEFEYLMINGDVEIARIIAKSSRKKIFEFSDTDVKYIVKQGSIYLDNEVQANRNMSIKKRDFTSKENEEDVYVFVLNEKGGTEFVYMELPDKILAHVNSFFKGKYKE